METIETSEGKFEKVRDLTEDELRILKHLEAEAMEAFEKFQDRLEDFKKAELNLVCENELLVRDQQAIFRKLDESEE